MEVLSRQLFKSPDLKLAVRSTYVPHCKKLPELTITWNWTLFSDQNFCRYAWTNQAHLMSSRKYGAYHCSNEHVTHLSPPFLPALEWWEITTVDLGQGGRANPEFAEHDKIRSIYNMSASIFITGSYVCLHFSLIQCHIKQRLRLPFYFCAHVALHTWLMIIISVH